MKAEEVVVKVFIEAEMVNHMAEIFVEIRKPIKTWIILIIIINVLNNNLHPHPYKLQ